jgi:hypothetical protein
LCYNKTIYENRWQVRFGLQTIVCSFLHSKKIGTPTQQ